MSGKSNFMASTLPENHPAQRARHALKLPLDVLLSLYRDPVLAAEVLLEARLDIFQQARLRYLWFTTFVIDSSGWSTGKTFVEWIFANLRALLLPDHRVGVYYPNFQIGKDEFWSYFERCESELYRAQLREGKWEWLDAGCWRAEVKNGSVIYLPAPSMTQNAETQVSRRFNTLIVGEYTQSAKRGSGVDELIGRNSRQSFNKQHPVWANHYLLSAHAESPSHPSYRYYRASRDSIAGKHSAAEAQQNALISFSYLDWSERPIDPANPSVTYRKQFRDDKVINTSRRTLSKDEFRRRLLGVWSADGRDWYGEDQLTRALRSDLLPLWGRPPGCEGIYVLGADFAPGQTARAADSAFVVWRAVEAPRSGLWTWETGGRHYLVYPCYCHLLKGADVAQTSGLIHNLHLRFGFSLIVPDPGAGGGGAFVIMELRKPQQLIANALQNVVPLCTRDEPVQGDKQPIVAPFKRGSALDILWPPAYRNGDEGIIEAMHLKARERLEGRHFLWPRTIETRSRAELAAMTDLQRRQQVYLDIAWKQLRAIREKTTPDGKPMTTRRGHRIFEAAKGQKDAAYAALYGLAGLEYILHPEALAPAGDGEEWFS